MILDKVKLSPAALRYLPDHPDTHVTKDYLVTVVNTIDPSFLTAIIEELIKKR